MSRGPAGDSGGSEFQPSDGAGESSARLCDLTDATTLAGMRAFLEKEGRASLAELDFDFAMEPTEVAGVPCSWLTTPECERSRSTLIFVHGGAYVAGSVRSGASFALQVARGSGMRVLGVEYRLAPEHPYPAALDDVRAICQALLHDSDPSHVGVFGVAAGGGLVAASLLVLRDAGGALPAAAVLVSPEADLTHSVQALPRIDPTLSWREGLAIAAAPYVGGADPRHPYVSPAGGDYRGLSPLLLHSGSRDVMLSDAQRIARAAREAGVEVRHDVWEGFRHVFHYSYSVPVAREACDRIARFFASGLV